MIEDKYTFKRISKFDYLNLLPIFRSAFGFEPSISDLENKFNTSEFGQVDVGFIALSPRQEPAGYYGVYPVRIRIKNQIVLACQSGDTMVHKDHQGKGLFVSLAKSTYDLCQNLGLKAVFGFPSESSYFGFTKKLNWQHNENIRKYEIIVPTLPIGEVCYRVKSLRYLFQKWINLILFFFSEGNYFKGSIDSYSQDGVERDTDFWNYKLRNNKIKCIKINKKNVVLKWEGKLSIGDIEFSDEKEFNLILKKLRLLTFFIGINRITFYVSPASKIDEHLSNMNIKSSEGLAIGYLAFENTIDLSEMKFTYFDFDTF